MDQNSRDQMQRMVKRWDLALQAKDTLLTKFVQMLTGYRDRIFNNAQFAVYTSKLKQESYGHEAGN